MDQFNSWKTNLEQETKSAFVKPQASLTKPDMTTYTKFCCSKDGHYRNQVGEVRKHQ